MQQPQLADKGYQKLIEMGYSPALAEALSESLSAKMMDKLVVTHNPDRVVGGQSDRLVTFGETRTNSSLGNANQRASAALREWLETQVKINPDAVARIEYVDPDAKDAPYTNPDSDTADD
ncbi:hypothetical protein TPB0596_43200 [Tsukamurella pulmonis]|uniref:polymorphic toxin type 15 domain-containing protein n=1 Tax=Tsukamurella pulmonis TaxID=47312 RepID=UPI001EE10971|nr:polymorphic toxin type 15 domain-containing protein [Tsukamurella pulmonis]BDD84557.1 hypothetical protein TPB0596_43200 [Tsukamurella pulmonis]